MPHYVVLKLSVAKVVLVRDSLSPLWISVLLLFDPTKRVHLLGLAIFTLTFAFSIP